MTIYLFNTWYVPGPEGSAAQRAIKRRRDILPSKSSPPKNYLHTVQGRPSGGWNAHAAGKQEARGGAPSDQRAWARLEAGPELGREDGGQEEGVPECMQFACPKLQDSDVLFLVGGWAKAMRGHFHQQWNFCEPGWGWPGWCRREREK